MDKPKSYMSFKQILMFWPASQVYPTVVMTMARNPLKMAARPPDKTVRNMTPSCETVVYYWGEKRENSVILDVAARIQVIP